MRTRRPYDVLTSRVVMRELVVQAAAAIENADKDPPSDYNVFNTDRPIIAFKRDKLFKFQPDRTWEQKHKSSVTHDNKEQPYTIYLVSEGMSNQFLLPPKD